MDETYIKVKGVCRYLYRAVDKQGQTVDFLLTAKRDRAAAKRFFRAAMRSNGEPTSVTMDKSGPNKAAIDAINSEREGPIVIRQVTAPLLSTAPPGGFKRQIDAARPVA